jgi:hypothetical protein
MKIDFNPDSYCGLYCGACVRYRATKTEKIHELALECGLSPEEFQCNGCKANQVSGWCNSCAIRDCAKSRNINSCADCLEYPCTNLDVLQSNYSFSPQIDIFESLDYRKQKGTGSWLDHQQIRWSCPICLTGFGVNDKKCQGCGSLLNQF